MTDGHQSPWRLTNVLGVLGTGYALPGDAVSTATLIACMNDRFGFERGRDADLMASRLGIKTRHMCRAFGAAQEDAKPGQSNADLAALAVRRALDAAGLDAGDMAYLIGHTATPGSELPANIAMVADQLGYGGPHVELRQACTGFANALMIASGLIASGSGPVVIVGSESGSLFFDPNTLNASSDQIINMVQMGDAAAAIVLGAPQPGKGQLSSAWYGAIGLGRAPAISRASGARHFDHAFSAIRSTGHLLFEAGVAAATASGASTGDFDWIIPHQASGRIGAQLAARLEIDPDHVFVNADRRGNTGSAAIWLAFAELRETIAAGTRVLALGAEASKFMYGGFAYDHG